MSIQDFHSRLTTTADQSALMAALLQLTAVEDPAAVTGDDEPLGYWGVWTTGLAVG
jgi:hypothetical protein